MTNQRESARLLLPDITDEEFDERWNEAMQVVAGGEVLIGNMVDRLFVSVLLGWEPHFAAVLRATKDGEPEPLVSLHHPFENRSDLAAFLRGMADEAERIDQSETFERTVTDAAALADFLPGE